MNLGVILRINAIRKWGTIYTGPFFNNQKVLGPFTIDKANLFNDYFFDQFSDASNYDISVDWSNGSLFDIDFDALEV